ncbi:NAD(P)-binding protein [Viridothelium virens]|uniref:NAD(P)-binding protein n=1 Tax=Viridothelium virens TaxID=1048519 RepID=A0A6A6HPL1_VIRVR|nr:NAD(P)-binding protein [Viridothelium virens]
MGDNTATAPIVLVTGANGYIGYHVLAGALTAGYQVRAAVRRQEGIDAISKGPTAQKYISQGLLTFVLVPEYVPGALDDALNDCSFIVHIASPLPLQPGNLVVQALAGTKTVLEAAEKTRSVQRVVITSSTAALRPYERLSPSHPDNEKIAAGRADEVATLTAETRTPDPGPVPEDASPSERYIPSKAAALRYTEEFMSQRNPHFDVVNIMPGFVLGPEELAFRKKEAFTGSNLIFGWLFEDFVDWNAFLGFPPDIPAAQLAEVVSLNDTVEAHVNALDIEKVKVPDKCRNFLLLADGPTGPTFADLEGIVKRNLPNEVKTGAIPFKGKKFGTLKHKFDAGATERDLLGHKFDSYEKMATETVAWYVRLPE